MITKEMIKMNAPAVYSTSPSSKMSGSYSFVPTFELLEKFELDGWNISSVKQSGKGVHSLHEIRLRNGELPKVGDSVFEAIIRNSHNGTVALSLRSGLYRLVCSNGLTVPTSISESFTLRHTNLDMGQIRSLTDSFAKKLPIIKTGMDRMMGKELSKGEKIRLVRESLKIKFGEQKNEHSNSVIEDILTPNREEDKGDNLWNVFNTIQEKFIRGGFSYNNASGRLVTSRGINGIVASNKINTQLWELANQYC